MTKWITILVMVMLAGCQLTQSTVPKGYAGEIAYIDDSIDNASFSTAQFFYVDKIGETNIKDAVSHSDDYSYSNNLAKKGASRAILANRKQTFHLIGQVHHSAPIIYMMNPNSNYIVEGSIEFTPLENNHYIVGGELSEQYSAVWIEDINGNIVSDKVEKLVGESTSKVRVLKENSAVLEKRNILQHFEHLRAGESRELVLKKLGEPTDMMFVEGNLFTQRRAKIIYIYEDIGSIEFNTVPRNDKQAHYVNEVLLALQGESQLARIKQEIMTKPAAELRALAKNYAKQDSFSTDVLDFMADRIWLEKDSTDGVTIDATSWLCKVLAKSANGRYKLYLEKVARSTGSKKLKKYAEISAADLPTSERPYMAGANLIKAL